MKRVFDMDLYIKDSVSVGETVEDMEANSLWADRCDGQEAHEFYTGQFYICLGTDGKEYRVLKEWTRQVEE